MTPTNCKTPKTARIVCLLLVSAAFLTLIRSGLSQIPIPIGGGQHSKSNKSSASKDDDFGKVFKDIMAGSVVAQARKLDRKS